MNGLVLGKFMPPHRGHQYLIDFAGQLTENLTIVVGSLSSEPICGELRFSWMKELYPQHRVLHLTDENPQLPEEHSDFWNIWKTSLERLSGQPVDRLFASEAYGQKLAKVLGAEFFPTNNMRSTFSVSASQVRESPVALWSQLPRLVQSSLIQKVVVLGPNPQNTLALCRELGSVFPSCVVPSYTRSYLRDRNLPPSLTNWNSLIEGQRASEKALSKAGFPLLICELEPHFLEVWGRELFDGFLPERKPRDIRSYALTFLLEEIECVFPTDGPRKVALEKYLQELEREEHEVVVLKGSAQECFLKARTHIAKMLKEYRLN